MSPLSNYHLQIISMYFNTISDFVSLQMVCKKYKTIMECFHTNPIPLTSTTIRFFPNVETLNLWFRTDENFGNSFVDSYCDVAINKFINFEDLFASEEYFSDPKPQNKLIKKKKFYKINIYYEVDYNTFLRYKKSHFVFKSVLYTSTDCQKYGEEIPENVSIIQEHCFSNNEKITYCEVPRHVLNIRNRAFFICYYLTKVVLNYGLCSIGDDCFSACYNLEEIEIPESVTYIGNTCFKSDYSLKKMNIPKSITKIGNSMFKYCRNLSSITMKNVIEIGNYCFEDCTELSEIVVDNLKVVGINCFENCEKLDITKLINSKIE
ncbi:hypothetical protein EIN_191740 [Entamoeba invadens IP1]|uniref:Leucine rich repeat containing protein BspA family protein n=1 Tax=Entamoeba invadens IP1 TaxID=370355 RepID=A0A0A1U6X3_ENTIV|nr:hypothetical protein EIN_191740 [Entamoeba invadens IP1]ELP88665.1 hypothetical protein EIN_191740 [Entamoeba invadens IP1]|eukprot:XP_004255436.1 hypothetical protein EIN_191740 [Entamoeba invadens IP1]